jgi:hypothetical protein
VALYAAASFKSKMIHYLLSATFLLITALSTGQATSSISSSLSLDNHAAPAPTSGVWDGRLSIAIITNASTESRISSLYRLMTSLLSADYTLLPSGSSISLNVNIDVGASTEVVDYMQNLAWPYGPKTIRR